MGVDIDGNIGPASAVGSGAHVEARDVAGRDLHVLQQQAAVVINQIIEIETGNRAIAERVKNDTDDGEISEHVLIRQALAGLAEQNARGSSAQRYLAEIVAGLTQAWIEHRIQDRTWKASIETVVGEVHDDMVGDGEGVKARGRFNRILILASIFIGSFWFLSLTAAVLLLARHVAF